MPVLDLELFYCRSAQGRSVSVFFCGTRSMRIALFGAQLGSQDRSDSTTITTMPVPIFSLLLSMEKPYDGLVLAWVGSTALRNHA